MNIFNNKQAIYLQIADLFSEKILRRIWKGGDKLPTVGDTALAFEVNPHISNRTFHYLQEKGTILQKQDKGYYLTGDGYEKILAMRRERFIKDELPLLFERMALMEISLSQLQTEYDQFIRNSKPS